MPTTTITSTANDRVKALVRLQRQASVRREAGAFCVETRRELARALDNGFTVHELYLCPAKLREPVDSPPGAEVVEVSAAVLDKITYREHPEGLVAVVADRRAALGALDEARAPLIVVAAGLEKPGNIGAIIRSADVAGATAVFIDAPGYDLFNPNCIRASTGAVFSLPIVCGEPGELDAWLTERGVLRCAATPEATLTYTMFRQRGPIAWIVGAEAEGLGAFWRERADLCVAVPAAGRTADSLNVASCATLLMFETVRQRRG